MKQIWYGSKNDTVRFAESKEALTTAGITDPQSFNVNGEVTGLQLINEQPVGQSQSQHTA